MNQPKYSPQEALERVKLMMKYDTSKTLNENIGTIKQPVNEIAPLLGLIPMAVPWLVGYGAAALTGIGAWIYNTQGGGDSFSKTQSFFAGCKKNIKDLKPTVSKSEYRAAADSIYNAIDGFGTTLPTIKAALSSMPTVADLCALNSWYSTQYGDLYEDLDGDIDGTDFTKYVWSAIAPTVSDAEDDLENAKKTEEDCKKNPNQEKCKVVTGSGTSNKYKPCSGTYKINCMSPKIGEAQACLGGLVVDNKFGPKTLDKLREKGFESTFTDSDVAKICKKSEDKPEVGGEVSQTGETDV